VQTAQNFVRGFLGNSAATLGTVITVNSTGSPEALFDSLSPSDLCPNFVDASGGTNGEFDLPVLRYRADNEQQRHGQPSTFHPSQLVSML
jgi:hypothetical protein